MCAFRLYILKHESHSEDCTLALSVSPTERNLDGGKLQTTSYKSWHRLSEMLSQAGIAAEALVNGKAPLDAKGFSTVREISLSPDQLHSLGFRP